MINYQLIKKKNDKLSVQTKNISQKIEDIFNPSSYMHSNVSTAMQLNNLIRVCKIICVHKIHDGIQYM